MQFGRGVEPVVVDLLSRHKVVVLEGARAVGKTTFVKKLVSDFGGSYIDLSDGAVLTAMKANPEEILESSLSPVVVDEAQLLEGLSLQVKRIVDRNESAGQFLLTGSSRISKGALGGSDPLAGRSASVKMYPLTVAERLGNPVNAVGSWFEKKFYPNVNADKQSGLLMKQIIVGGLPDNSVKSKDLSLDDAWMFGQEVWPAYLNSVVSLAQGKYDVDRSRLIQMINYLSAVPSQIINLARVSNDLGIHKDTVRRYLEISSDSMLMNLVKSLRPNAHKSLTAHPKLSVFDTGFACWAAKVSPDRLLTTPQVWGGLVENFVSLELMTQASWLSSASETYHWRQANKEVDCVLVGPDNSYLAVEVKAASTVSTQDAYGIKAFKDKVGDKFLAGIIMYSGTACYQLNDYTWAMPISNLWADQ